jgi:hypothetical protein
MHGVNGRPPKHGPQFRFTRPETWPEPAITTVTDTTNATRTTPSAYRPIDPGHQTRLDPPKDPYRRFGNGL